MPKNATSSFPELFHVDMTNEWFPETLKKLDEGVKDQVAPGFVVGAWFLSDPNRFFSTARGQRRISPLSLPMERNTVFDYASVSKVFATATLTALLVDRHWLNWDTPVSNILTDFKYSKIQIRHLLSHTAGFPAWIPFFKSLQEKFAPKPLHRVSIVERQKAMRSEVFATALEFEPGARTLYSDLGFMTLGFVLEEILQMPLDQAAEKELWAPRGIRGAHFRRVTQSIEAGREDSAAATESCSWRGGVVQGQVHDENCWAMGGYAGHAGVFGQISDLMQFSKRLLTGFLSSETLQAMWTRVSQPPGCERTLGWDTPSGAIPSSGKLFSSKSVGHLGFTGTSLWIDPEAKLAVALLSNRVHTTRDNIKIREFRPVFHDAIRKDLANLNR